MNTNTSWSNDQIETSDDPVKGTEAESPNVMKPKQPLSAYNLFFQFERRRILDGTDHLQLPISADDLKKIVSQQKHKPKRVHRKTHGKIGFRDLARVIASRWKVVDPKTRKVFDDQAVVERQEYSRKLSAWKEVQKAQELKRKQSKKEEDVEQTGGFLPRSASYPGSHPVSQRIEDRFRRVVDHVSGRQGTASMQNLQQLRDLIQGEIVRLATNSTSGTSAAAQVTPFLHSMLPKAPQVVTSEPFLAQPEPSSASPRFEPSSPFSQGSEALFRQSQNHAPVLPRSQETAPPHVPERNNVNLTSQDLMLSPILGGDDLFEAIDSQEMDELFE